MSSPRQFAPLAAPNTSGSGPRVFVLPAPHPAPSGTGAGALDTTGPATAYAWLLAWLLVILVLALANRTRIGHTLIYYALVLALVFLIVTQAQWFAAALAPFGTPVTSLDQSASASQGGGGTSGGF